MTLLLLALFASACASSNYVVGEPAAPASSASDTEATTGIDLEAAMATVTPVPTATAAPVTELETEDAEAADPDVANGPIDESALDPVATPTPAPTTTPVPTATAAPLQRVSDAFAVGRCYRSGGTQAGEAIPCTESHRAEVVMIGQFRLGPDAPYPTNAEANRFINEQCGPVANAIGLVNASGMSTLPHWSYPRDWAKGDRSFVCFVKFDQSVTSSLASIAADQQERRAQEQAERETAWQEEANERVADQQIGIGDCVSSEFTKVPCSQPHDYKAFGIMRPASAGDVYPGSSLILEQSSEYCRRELTNAGLTGDIFSLYPQRWEWEDYGIRAVVCLLVS